MHSYPTTREDEVSLADNEYASLITMVKMMWNYEAQPSESTRFLTCNRNCSLQAKKDVKDEKRMSLHFDIKLYQCCFFVRIMKWKWLYK